MPRSPLPARLVALFLLGLACGCHHGRRDPYRGLVSPVKAGLNTNDLIDPVAQPDADELNDVRGLFAAAERMKKHPTPEQIARRRSILCLSGGGSYGAYSAGVLCGWTASGDRPGCGGRPNFAVVTGISTGALIAPLAFLGPQYDEQVRAFYTTIDQDDIYRLRPVRGLFSAALADNTPLANLIDRVLTPQLVDAVAVEHAKGRRLYVGTTELEGRRFIYWDIGAIASRGRPEDRELIKKILLGSSAIPGFFPPAEIPVTVNGQTYVEKHGDGGVSMSIFLAPPYVPPDQRTPETTDLAGVDLYMIVAGKLYADAEPLRPRALTIAESSITAVIYAQTRGDLQRLFLIATLAGMNYRVAAIPADFPAPASSTDFERGPMTAMFNEGYRRAASGQVWRRTPPGVGPGETPLKRQGTDLIYQPRGGTGLTTEGGPGTGGILPIPGFPGPIDK